MSFNSVCLLPPFNFWESCPRRPAVELTRFVDIDPSTGAVDVPPASRLTRHVFLSLSPETEAELRTLRSQIATLESEQLRSTLRAKTIDSRYRSGDLVCATSPCQTPCSLVAARTRKRSHSYIISCRHRKLSMNRTRPLIATSFDECVGFHPTSTLVNRSAA